MMFFGRHGWSGESGRTYTFKCALTKHGIPNDSGGIYVFVRRRFGFFLKGRVNELGYGAIMSARPRICGAACSVMRNGARLGGSSAQPSATSCASPPRMSAA